MISDRPTTRYAVLRDGSRWEWSKLTGLELDENGVLHLATVPAPDEAVNIDAPYSVEPSGVAVGKCGDLFIADTNNSRIIWRDRICQAQMILPNHGQADSTAGHFNEPLGLVLGAAGLYVADSGNAWIQVFRLPTLELRAAWTGLFQTPSCLAIDPLSRIYVVDSGLKRVLRLNAWGAPDDAYNKAVSTALVGKSPKFCAVDSASRLYIADEVNAAICCFDESGGTSKVLPLPTNAPDFHAGALVVAGSHLYVADTNDGRIRIYDLQSQQCIGQLPGWCGPVTALAVADGGDLYVKSDSGETIHMLPANTGVVSSGELVTERLDAGESSRWFRTRIDTEQPEHASVTVQTFVTNNETITAPAEVDWTTAPALDLLLPEINIPTMSEPQGYRFLWLRIRLRSDDGRTSPRLLQAEAETPGEDYINHLPGVYRRKDTGFLRQWLALFRGELGDLELLLEELPRHFNAATVPGDELPWLASWLAFDLPPGSLQQSRDRFAKGMELYRRRGTPFGVREFVEIYTGVRPIIVESFRGRRLWQLGHTSMLGCDTGLAPLSPNGMILPDRAQLCDPTCDSERPMACSTDRLTIGSAIVGASGPQAANGEGDALFGETAHHFSVFVSKAQLRKPSDRELLQKWIEAERPAHTDYDLCIVEPRMRVGLQSSIGIDTYVAGPPDAMALTGSVLGVNSYVGEEPGEHGASRVGRRALVGSETVLE